jgi:hypothetical protein
MNRMRRVDRCRQMIWYKCTNTILYCIALDMRNRRRRRQGNRLR